MIERTALVDPMMVEETTSSESSSSSASDCSFSSTVCTAVRKVRSDNDVTPGHKRQRCLEREAPSVMEVEMARSDRLRSDDEVLIQMIQTSGVKLSSYSDVVDFCRSVGIPLSRMLRLDLMRLVNNTAQCVGHAVP